MTSTSLDDLIKVTQLTEFMLQKADDEQWDELTKLEKHRASLLKAIFPIEQAQQQAELTQQLETLIKLNTKLEAQCKQNKQRLQLQIQGVSNNKKAIKAYQSL
jgi:hypothetical protein